MLSRSRKAFTLLELIVVIVILGILAALAIPTFKAVIDRSKMSTAETSALATGREAIALAAFEGRNASAVDLTAAVADTNSKVAFDEADWKGGDVAGTTTVTEDASAVVTVNGYDVTLGFDGNVVALAAATVAH